MSQSHVLVWHSLLFTLAILRFHLFDIVTCSHSFHTLLVLLFYKCSLVPICNFVSYSYLNWKPAQHWCSDCCPVTVVTSHTASNSQAYTSVMSMLQKAAQSTHCTSCNQPAHTNVIMSYAVKCSLYVVGPFLCRTLHKSWSAGGENVTKLLGVPNEPDDKEIFSLILFKSS